ncbi:MAG TPA: signal recognition particle protein [Steroidobacteraceae bacterium]|jgi:signal recognition particle subunit SRP54|nr:signal recognition particle protein [Steroidobacteraceae bacterium]
MFDKLTERLGRAVQTLRGRGRLTDENVAETLREVRMALLEADVALPVIKAFVDSVKADALGAEVSTSLTPGQAFIGILHRQMVALLGVSQSGFSMNVQPPQVVLLAGLQGAGKTTTAAKLARWLKETHRRRVLLVSTDVRRPAAILQLQRLAETVGADFFPSSSTDEPTAIARAALEAARRGVYQTLIVDTAGRLHVDADLMQEMKDIDQAVTPHQRLFVVDSMGGQDAVNAARAFSDALELTGIVLTKADGDARGGAALSVRYVTGKPIVFMGVGEKVEALQSFDPERMASRILGMGDVVSLVEEVQRKVDVDEAQKLAKKVVQGKAFTLTDLRGQLEQVRKLGGLSAVMDKLPTQLAGKAAVKGDQADRELKRQIAIIDSMTKQERRQSGIIDGPRRRRIATGAGVQVQDVNRLLKQFMDMQRLMKNMKGGKLARLMAQFKGGMVPGLPPRR